jgi:leader peptidase (prepilin peptidase)/N-methyltransferase
MRGSDVSAVIFGLDVMRWLCVGVLGTGLGALSWIDLRTGFLPFKIQIPLAVIGAMIALIGSPAGITWQLALAGAAVNGGVFAGLRWLVTRWKGREAMGEGDIWLVAMGGLWIGPWMLPYIMAFAGIGTLAGAGIVGAIQRRAVWQGEMPLGPGLALGIFGCFLAGVLHVPWLRLTGL